MKVPRRERISWRGKANIEMAMAEMFIEHAYHNKWIYMEELITYKQKYSKQISGRICMSLKI